MRALAASSLLLALPAACAAPGGDGSSPRTARAAAASAAGAPEEAIVMLASGPAGERADPPPAPERPASPAVRNERAEDPAPWLDPSQLSVWGDPSFERRFEESYLALTDVEPPVTEDEVEELVEIFALIHADELDKAMAQLKKRAGETASAAFDFTMANVHIQRDELEQAAALYEVAVRKYPRFLRAWQALGEIYFRRAEWVPATRALTRVVELGAADAVTYGLLGIAYSNLEKNIAAESAFRMATLLEPDRLDWQMNLGYTFYKQRRFAEAVTLFDALIAGDPDNARLWLLQGGAYLGLEQPRKAAENFELLDSLGGSTADSLYTLGSIYVNEGVYDLAADAYLRSMEMSSGADPRRALEAATNLAARSAFADTRRLLDGIESLYEGKLETQTYQELLRLRARIAVAEGGEDEEHVRILERIIQIDPLDGAALILLGDYHKRAGDTAQALLFYKRAALVESSEADANVRQAEILVGQRKFREALPLLKRAQELKPRDHIQDYLEKVERAARSR